MGFITQLQFVYRHIKMQSLVIFVVLIFKPFQITAADESFDSAFFDNSELEFAKDITTLIVESTLKSKCDGNVVNFYFLIRSKYICPNLVFYNS